MVSRDKWSNNKYANGIPEKERNHRSFDTTRNLHQRSLHKKTMAIFFDLEKVYDTTRKYGIMRNLHDLGLSGRLPMFIKTFSLKEHLGYAWDSPFQTHNIKRMVFHKAASSPLHCSPSKSIILLNV